MKALRFGISLSPQMSNDTGPEQSEQSESKVAYKIRRTKTAGKVKYYYFNGESKPLKDHLQDILVYSIAMVVICVGWPGFLVWAALKKREDRMRELEVDEPDYLCKPEYLVRKVSLIEAEQENRITDPLGLTPNLTFGHLNAAWGKFLAEFGLEEENELWFFEVPKGSSTGEYDMFDGPICGYAKVVKGKVCGEFVIEAGE